MRQETLKFTFHPGQLRKTPPQNKRGEAGVVARLIEFFPNVHEALGLILSTA